MFFHHLVIIFDWLAPFIYLLGLAIAVWAFRRSRKRGYLVVAAYFALCVFSLWAMPSINRALEARTPDLSKRTREKLDKAIADAVERVMAEEGEGSELAAHIESVHIPFGPTLLVLGVWLIAGRERAPQCISTSHVPIPPR
jgi:hypothetical protein